MNSRTLNGGTCTVCSAPLRGRQTKYCCHKHKDLACGNYVHQKKRGDDRKLKLVKNLGGACSICGYAKNSAALVLHHYKDKKQMDLSKRVLSNRSWKSIQEEVKKCILLCANCHAEEHYPNCKITDS